ncbi:uncharacterized protein ACNS7B_011766 [Menidia menidia]
MSQGGGSVCEDREKSLYLTQIRHLDEQLERCQLACDGLRAANRRMSGRLAALRADRLDVRRYLQHSSLGRGGQVQQLELQLQARQRHSRGALEELRGLLLQEGQQLQGRLDQLDALNRQQAAGLVQQQAERGAAAAAAAAAGRPAAAAGRPVATATGPAAPAQGPHRERGPPEADAGHAAEGGAGGGHGGGGRRPGTRRRGGALEALLKANELLATRKERVQRRVEEGSGQAQEARLALDRVSRSRAGLQKELESAERRSRLVEAELRGQERRRRLLLAQEEALSSWRRRPEVVQVEVQQPEVQVEVQVEVQQPEAQVEVQQPEVQVEAQGEVQVEAQVEVQQPEAHQEAQVEVQQPEAHQEAQVEVQQPEAHQEAQVEVQQPEAQVEVQQPEVQVEVQVEVQQLEARLRAAGGRRARLEGVLRRALVLLSAAMEAAAAPGQQNPEQNSEAQLRKLLDLLDGAGSQPSGSPDPEATRSAPEAFGSDPLFLLAKLRPGDLGLVPRPSSSRPPFSRGRPPPTRGTLWQLAYQHWVG